MDGIIYIKHIMMNMLLNASNKGDAHCALVVGLGKRFPILMQKTENIIEVEGFGYGDFPTKRWIVIFSLTSVDKR